MTRWIAGIPAGTRAGRDVGDPIHVYRRYLFKEGRAMARYITCTQYRRAIVIANSMRLAIRTESCWNNYEEPSRIKSLSILCHNESLGCCLLRENRTFRFLLFKGSSRPFLRYFSYPELTLKKGYFPQKYIKF